MQLFREEFNNLEDLFWAEIGDLYDAEQRLTKALPNMAKAAHSPELRQAFQSHLSETENQVRRLEQIFNSLGHDRNGTTCKAMKGLIEEGDQMIGAKGDPDVRDAALIAAAQRVEHYEISGYGSARVFAHRLGYNDAARLLQETLDEEKQADHKLNMLAEQSVNVRAQRASGA
jgi:ferritin-like metal-binding protein YciE